LLADSRALLNQARDEAAEYKNVYHESIPGRMLADRMGQFVQAYTLHGSVRPFGTTALFGLMDEFHGPQLYMIEPSGVYWVRAAWKIPLFHCFRDIMDALPEKESRLPAPRWRSLI
jgi:20S proteasome alpha/beta subunit